MIPDYLKVIRLGHGAGHPGASACWMTALQAHMNGEWTDQCACVDPLINELCICINDAYKTHNAERTEDILEFGLFRVLGTKGTLQDTLRRALYLADYATHVVFPYYASLANKPGTDIIVTPSDKVFCSDLAALPRITDLGSFDEVFQCVRRARQSSTLPLDLLRCLSHVEELASTVEFADGALSVDEADAPIMAVDNCMDMLCLHPIPTESFDINYVRTALKTYAFPLLAGMVECGPHGPTEAPVPVCSIEEFHKRVGCAV